MFKNKTVVVTGGARGIGLGFTKFFVREKANVIVCDVNDDNLNFVNNEIGKSGNLKALKVDISKEDEAESFFELIRKENNGTDILINNAGIGITGLIDEIPIDDWDKVIAVNLRGAFLCTRYALSQMKKKNWGRIINLTSPSGKTGGAKVSGQGAYAASKAGLICLTKTSAREGAKFGITVNGISPGCVLTEISKKFPDEERKSLLDIIPMGRFGTVEEVVKLGKFLASEDAGYITGQVIHINGGMWMLE